MLKRKDIEKIENKTLAPYAMKSCETKGREHDEPQHDFRTCYQRDRDRIIHSTAFRKLEYKTQVFVVIEGDYYRTRLTHTIEVAQIARTIGRNLCLNEDLIEAIALAHDLGHPPFGHAGETALKEIMKKAKIGGFNHNLRSFEIVTEEKRYPDFKGLNLTQEVLIGILKHETDYDKISDLAKYKNIGPTLEAKVVDIADSLAYLSHDIDDGITSGCLTVNDLMESDLWKKACGEIGVSKYNKDKDMFKYQVVKYLINFQTKDLLSFSNDNLKSLGFKSSSEVKKYFFKKPRNSVISFSPLMKKERNYLQRLLDSKLYHHFRVERMTEKAKRIINEIFDVYSNNPKQLPYEVYKRSKQYSKSKKYKVICNYISDMTDRYALDEHKRLFDPYQKV